jgi:hypothetical protein
MSNSYISIYMPSALFHMLYAECYGLYAKLHMLDCNISNAMTIAMSFSMTTEQVGHLIINISIIRLWLSILPLQRKNYYYTTMASVYISGLRYFNLLAHQTIKWYLESHVFQYADMSWHEQNFSMPTYHGINPNPQSPFILICQHIKASINNSYHHLFWHASISRHSIIPLVIANSGSVIYRDSNLKANKYHISYHIRSNRVSWFNILT